MLQQRADRYLDAERPKPPKEKPVFQWAHLRISTIAIKKKDTTLPLVPIYANRVALSSFRFLPCSSTRATGAVSSSTTHQAGCNIPIGKAAEHRGGRTTEMTISGQQGGTISGQQGGTPSVTSTPAAALKVRPGYQSLSVETKNRRPQMLEGLAARITSDIVNKDLQLPSVDRPFTSYGKRGDEQESPRPVPRLRLSEVPDSALGETMAMSTTQFSQGPPPPRPSTTMTTTGLLSLPSSPIAGAPKFVAYGDSSPRGRFSPRPDNMIGRGGNAAACFAVTPDRPGSAPSMPPSFYNTGGVGPAIKGSMIHGEMAPVSPVKQPSPPKTARNVTSAQKNEASPHFHRKMVCQHEFFNGGETGKSRDGVSTAQHYFVLAQPWSAQVRRRSTAQYLLLLPSEVTV